jgi:hypothetical protein
MVVSLLACQELGPAGSDELIGDRRNLAKAREAADEISYDGELVAPLDLDIIPR